MKIVVLILAFILVTQAQVITWYNCPLFTNNQTKSMAQKLNVQCAYVSVPISPEMSDVKIKIFVKRIVAPAATKQVWLLDGGPGIDSSDMEDVMLDTYTLTNATFDVYTTDHRGVGRSTRLNCEAPQAETLGSDQGVTISLKEYPSCVANMKAVWGDLSNYFSVTGAARDVLQLIQLTKNTQQVAIYGVSYGTFLTGRIMQLDENKLVDAVVLDGIITQAGSQRLTFDKWDLRMNQVGLNLLQQCDKDHLCSNKLKNSTNIVNNLFDKLFVQQKCKFVLPMVKDAATLRSILGTMLQDVYQRELIPALIYRLNRCDDDIDYGVLNYFFTNYLTHSPLLCHSYTGYMLKYNIDMAELWNKTPLEQIETYFNQSIFATGQMVKANIYSMFVAQNAIYPTDAYFDKTFNTNVPVLLLNGDLDPQTPVEFAYAQKENMDASPKAKLIVIPQAAHVTIYSSPVNNSQVDCGMQLYTSFLQNWDADLDTSCLSHLRGLNFTGNPSVSVALFGVQDIYEAFYEPPTIEPMISLWTLVGAEAGTLVAVAWVLILLIRYAFELHRKKNVSV